MANRFFDTNYYKSPFVRRLKGSLKSLYSFIICDCDGAGIWNLDLDAASLYTGFEISLEEFETHFVKTGKAVDIGKNKYFFPDFIEHQYPQGLQAKNPAQKNFIATLKKFGLVDENLILKKGAKEGLQSPTSNGNGIGNGNGKGNGSGNSFGKSENLFAAKERLIPRMNEIWITSFPSYSASEEYDFPALKNMADFIFKQAGVKNGIGDVTHEDTCVNTFQLIADQVNREPFWVNKPLQSISKHVQEFYNKIKNPQANGTAKSNGKTNAASPAEVQAELKSRLAAK